jgi:hypothetical protein
MGFMVTRSGRTTPHCDERLKTLEQMSVSLPEFARTPDMTPQAGALPRISVDDTVLYNGPSIDVENTSASPDDDIGGVADAGVVEEIGEIEEDSPAPQCSTPIRPSTASTLTQMDMSCIPPNTANPANPAEPSNHAQSSLLDPTVTSGSVKIAQFASTHSVPLLDETVVIQSRAKIGSKEEVKLERVDSLSSVVSQSPSDAPSSPRGDSGRKGSRHLPQPPQSTPTSNPFELCHRFLSSIALFLIFFSPTK